MLRMIAALLLVITGFSRGDLIYLNILHTNDIHGGIAPTEASFMNPDFPPGMGGGAWIATYVNQVREECEASGEHFLLVDCGDIWQGTPWAITTQASS